MELALQPFPPAGSWSTGAIGLPRQAIPQMLLLCPQVGKPSSEHHPWQLMEQHVSAVEEQPVPLAPWLPVSLPPPHSIPLSGPDPVLADELPVLECTGSRRGLRK